jgi:hypothetical protein
VHQNINQQQGFTHYLNDAKRFDVSSKGPSSGIRQHVSVLGHLKRPSSSVGEVWMFSEKTQ